MNKSAFQPLPVLLRAEPNDARGTSHSAVILRVIAALGTLFALGGTIAIMGKPPFAFIARRRYSTGEWRLWGLCYVVVACALA